MKKQCSYSILDLGKNIKVIVITGGPCSGKTTSLARLRQMLEDRDWKVIVSPESATKLMNGGVLIAPNELHSVEFQEIALFDNLFQSGVMFSAAQKYRDKGRKVVILCDRGPMDGQAYIGKPAFETLIHRLMLTHQELCESSSHAVIHLRTAAIGAEAFYTLDNNEARTETAEEARAIDEQTLYAWLGHPHHRIIDNSTNFEGKLHRLFAEVCAVLGDPVPLEKEDKFLVESFNFSDLPSDLRWFSTDITQDYLFSLHPAEERRVRARSDAYGSVSYYYAEKRPLGPGVRIENERIITLREYEKLIEELDSATKTIKKRRICFFWKEQFFELDVFQSPVDNLVLMEVERTDRTPELQLPPFIKVVRNVTGEKQYSNHEIAKIGVKKRTSFVCGQS